MMVIYIQFPECLRNQKKLLKNAQNYVSLDGRKKRKQVGIKFDINSHLMVYNMAMMQYFANQLCQPFVSILLDVLMMAPEME
jgi:hypothetical protein